MHTAVGWRNLKEIDSLEKLDVDGRVILKHASRK
jgi:hypothetical protein